MPSIRATAVATPRSQSTGQFIASRVTPAVRAGVEAFAKIAHQYSQEYVHVKTGRLKASGTESPFAQDAPGGVKITETDKTVRAEIVYTAPYASYLEYKFPFLRPGLDNAREDGMALFRGQISAGMK
jgi:hypothetical protein